MMNTDNVSGQSVSRVSSPSNRATAAMVDMRASGEAAKDVAAGVAAMQRDALARDVADSMLRQGKSAVEVWDALVSGGVEPGAAEALVKELLNVHRQVGIGPYLAPPEAPAVDTEASPGLWLVAITVYIVHVAVHMSIKPSQSSGAEAFGALFGTLLGALLWPSIVVGIASIWRSNRTQKRRVLVFTIATVVFLMAPITLILALSKT
jgi:hypothetical protein